MVCRDCSYYLLLLFCLARFFFGMPESDVMVEAVAAKNHYLNV